MTGSSARQLLPYQIVFAVTMGAIAGIIAVLGELRDELEVSNTSIGIIVAAGFLASFLAQVAFAPMADRGHGRMMAVAGISLSAIALFVMVFADSVLVWVGARAALGFAGGLLVPGLRRAASVLDPARAGENLGRLVVGEVIGFLAGPIAAAALVVVGGVRAPFFAFGVFMVLFLPFVWRLPADSGKRDDRRTSSLELLRYRRLQGALVLVFGYFVLIGAFESVIPVMFRDRGAGSLTVGISFTVFAIPVAALGPYAGRLADRIGGATVALAGMALAAAATTSYGFIPGVFWLVVAMTVVAVGDGFGFTAGQVAVARSVPEERQAAALGLMGAAQVLGAGVAALPAAALYESRGARVTWVTVGLCSLLVLLTGYARLRGTEPLASAGGGHADSSLQPAPSIAEVGR